MILGCVFRYLGFLKTILLDQRGIVEIIDQYKNGTLDWDNFSSAIRQAHEGRTGTPFKRRVIPGQPKQEDYFYSNPQECLCSSDYLGSPANSRLPSRSSRSLWNLGSSYCFAIISRQPCVFQFFLNGPKVLAFFSDWGFKWNIIMRCNQFYLMSYVFASVCLNKERGPSIKAPVTSKIPQSFLSSRQLLHTCLSPSWFPSTFPQWPNLRPIFEITFESVYFYRFLSGSLIYSFSPAVVIQRMRFAPNIFVDLSRG